MKFNPDREMNRQENYYWWHVGKRNLITSFITAIIEKNNKPPRILDIGCSTGGLMHHLSKYGQTYGLDISPQAIEFCRQKGLTNLLIHDINNLLPYPDNYFDIIIILDVLEHLANEKPVLAEIKRIVKPDGYILLTVPAYPFLFSYWDKTVGHQRRYSQNGLKSLCQNCGFQVEKISFFNSFALLPAIIFRQVKGKLKSKRETSDFFELPNFLHAILIKLGSLESSLMKIHSLPFGLSLFALLKKPTPLTSPKSPYIPLNSSTLL